MTSNSFDLIKQSIKLSDYVAQATGVNLKGSAGKFRTTCPIHGGDNPSAFSINDKSGLWACHTGDCGGGSIIDFWLKLHKSDKIADALESLAQEARIALPEKKSGSKQVSTKRMIEAFDLVSDAALDYLMTSKNDDARAARRYLKSRGIGKRIVNERCLGLLPSGKRDSMDFVLDACDDKYALIEAGILGSRDGSTWVAQSGRLLFPIFNQMGDIVAFGARAIEGVVCSNEKSKYVNTTNTRLYDKSKTLYGMEEIPKSGVERILVVEGYLDVIGAMEHSDGSSVAVAACGTGFTREHGDFILKHSERQSFAFDGDKAGMTAVTKALPNLSSFSKNVSAALLPEGLDPWDMHLEGESVFDYCDHNESSLVSVAVDAKWAACDESEPQFQEWVRHTVPLLSFSSQKTELVSRAAKVLGKSASTYRRELNQVGVESSGDLSREDRDSQMSPQAREFIRGLMQMPDDCRDAALASMRQWKSLHESAALNWLPIVNDFDLSAFRKVVVGISASTSDSVDQELAALMRSSEDGDRVNMSHILRGLGNQALAGMTDDAISESYLPDSIRSVRSCLTNIADTDSSPEILAHLIDIVIDMERVSLAYESAERMEARAS